MKKKNLFEKINIKKTNSNSVMRDKNPGRFDGIKKILLNKKYNITQIIEQLKEMDDLPRKKKIRTTHKYTSFCSFSGTNFCENKNINYWEKPLHISTLLDKYNLLKMNNKIIKEKQKRKNTLLQKQNELIKYPNLYF